MTAGAAALAPISHLVDAFAVGVATLDAQRKIVLWNTWLADRSGIPAGGAAGRRIEELFPDAAHSRLTEAIDYAIDKCMPALLSPALNGGLLALSQTPGDKRPEGRMRHLIHVVPLADQPDVGACLLQITDVTAAVNRERLLRQQAEDLRRATQVDALTGLANRRYFDSLVVRELQQAQREGSLLALMHADIDQFGEYKALYGASRAESCVVQVAAALRDAAPYPDLISRYSEDEFAILMPRTDEAQICAIAAELCQRVRDIGLPHEAAPAPSLVTVSIGLAAIHPTSSSDYDDLISAVDIALFQAKSEGRNRALLFSMADGQFQTCA